jgi:hypothetical protein
VNVATSINGSTYKLSANQFLIEDSMQDDDDFDADDELSQADTPKKNGPTTSTNTTTTTATTTTTTNTIKKSFTPVKAPTTKHTTASVVEEVQPDNRARHTISRDIVSSPVRNVSRILSFQPGSTEFVSKGSTSNRYLAYNQIGKVKASYTTTQTDSYTIEVVLSDVVMGGHKPFEDLLKPDIAALCEHGVVFAKFKYENPAIVYYKPNTRGKHEWKYLLTNDENIQAVTCGYQSGKGFVAVSTATKLLDQEYYRLHIFDCKSGIQRSITVLSGPTVTMTASGNKLFHIYSDPLDGSLYYQFITIDSTNNTVHTNKLPIVGNNVNSLKWIGYSSVGLPSLQIGEQVLLFINQLDSWVPVTSEPLPTKSQVLYVSDQKIFYVRSSNIETVPFGASEQSKDIVLPFCLEHESETANEKRKFLVDWLCQYYVSVKRSEDNAQSEDFNKSDKALFLHIYDLIDNKNVDVDALAYFLPFIKQQKTINAVKKACESRKINIEPLLVQIQQQQQQQQSVSQTTVNEPVTAVAVETSSQPSSQFDTFQHQQTIEQLQQQIRQLQEQVATLNDRQKIMEEQNKKKPNLQVNTADLMEEATDRVVAESIIIPLLSSSAEDIVEESPSPGFFSPKRPRRKSNALDDEDEDKVKKTKKKSKTKADKATTANKTNGKKRKREESSTDQSEEKPTKKATQTKLFFSKKA